MQSLSNTYGHTSEVDPGLMAALELQHRRRARTRLIDCATYLNPLYEVEDWNELLGDTLDRVVSGEIDRLMIFAPPQHGKSLLVSRILPAYWFGRRPDDPIILASYAASLATGHAGFARDYVESDEFANLFPGVKVDPNMRASEHWRIKGHRGTLRAAGVGGGITGHPAMLGIIDDPFENWKEAQSPTIRNNVWEWWKGTFRTRVWERGAIILIMTRWNDDDLAGRLLKQQAARWHILRLPALAETQEERDRNDEYLCLPKGNPDPLDRNAGEPLSPKRFSKAALEEIKEDVGPMVWTAEYQGVPRAPEGNMLKREWLERYVDTVPRKCLRVRYWDKAQNEGTGTPRSAGVLIALDQSNGHWIVEDVVAGNWSVHKREEMISATIKQDASNYNRTVETYIEQEPGSGGKESADDTIQRNAGYSIRADRPTGDKDTRLYPFANMAEAGFIRLKRAVWNVDYVEEMIAVPNGSRRDLADASAGAFNKLAKYPRKEKRKSPLARAVQSRGV